MLDDIHHIFAHTFGNEVTIMLVEEWMTTNVITVTADTSMMKVARMLKDHNIRRMPVVNEDGVLIGIVTDRDVKDASPSKATTLEVHELYYLLSELKVKDIMTKNPRKAYCKDSVESIALMMRKHSFGGVPVVDDNEKVCGIITDTDIFGLLTHFTGIMGGGMQVALELPNKIGALKGVLDELLTLNVNIVSVLTGLENANAPMCKVYIRLSRVDDAIGEKVISILQEKFNLRYWEKGLSDETLENL